MHKKVLAVVVSDVEIESQYQQFERRLLGIPQQLTSWESLLGWLAAGATGTR